MDLNGIASRVTRAVTPAVPGALFLSTGYTTGADGKQTPTYDERTLTSVDMQALSGGDLRQLDAINVQGASRAAYLHGNIEGVNRVRGKGGDLVVISEGPGVPPAQVGTWLVVGVLETWADWCKVALALQNEAP